jgi:S1-C subfamily serine protease
MAQKELEIPKIVKKVLPAVVSITTFKYLTIFESPLLPPFFGFEEFFAIPKGKKRIQVGGGSGFIIDKSGLILTNRHVVADPKAEYIVVLNDGRKYKAQILAKDPIRDIAILKIQPEKPLNKKEVKVKSSTLPTLELGDSSKLELGQPVIAIGNTLGAFPNTVSTGVISGLSREIVADSIAGGEATRFKGLIQTDAAINPGNSGGPLIDLEGKVIGINVAMAFLAQNVGFALPINVAKKDIEEIKKYGKLLRPFLGVRYVIITKPLQERYDLPSDRGALVISEDIPGGEAVVPGGPADKAGIKEGDIILEVNKEKITPQNRLEEILAKYKVGDEIELKILREKKEIILKAILGEKK